MKQALLVSPFGSFSMFLRDKFCLVKMACFSAERVGTIANDQLASKIITQVCDAQKTFIDVGAHIGSILVEVKRHNPSVKIIAIEAMPGKVANLRRRVPFVELHNCAVGDACGEVSFFVDTQRSGYSSLARPVGNDKTKVEIKVSICRLDDLVSASDVDAIKIDVEGAELGVLRGAVRLLVRCRPIIMFESGPPTEDGLGYTKESMFEFLHAMSYAILIPNRLAHNDEGLELAGFIESHLYPRRTTNYFAVPKERRIEFRDKARRILGL